MTQPINLNKHRKARDRADQKARADQNARKFGRTKAQRLLEAAETDKLKSVLDGKRFEDDEC